MMSGLVDHVGGEFAQQFFKNVFQRGPGPANFSVLRHDKMQMRRGLSES